MTKPLTLSRAARSTARANGHRTYAGQDCDQRHGGKRYTSNGQCIACAKGQRSEQTERERDARAMGAALLDCL